MIPSLKESLRFEIIRRLTQGHLHKVFEKMQPISSLTHKDFEYSLSGLQDKTSLNSLSTTIEDMLLWLNSSEKEKLPLSEVVEECLELLRMEIDKSNVYFVNNVTSTDLVNVTTVRNMFTASVLTYLDTVNSPSEISVSTRLQSEDITIEMSVKPLFPKTTKRSNANPTFTDWSNIISLNESSNLIRTGNNVLITKIA